MDTDTYWPTKAVSDVLEFLLSICIWSTLVGLYFLPAVVASARKVRGFEIFAVNLLFGWTGIGWLLCLVWACAAKPLTAQMGSNSD